MCSVHPESICHLALRHLPFGNPLRAASRTRGRGVENGPSPGDVHLFRARDAQDRTLSQSSVSAPMTTIATSVKNAVTKVIAMRRTSTVRNKANPTIMPKARNSRIGSSIIRWYQDAVTA